LPLGLAANGSPGGLAVALALFVGKILALSVAVVVVETVNAKLRLFRVPDLLSAAFVLAALALLSTFLFQ
jgi:formate hydrogenlyase subunit 4